MFEKGVRCNAIEASLTDAVTIYAGIFFSSASFFTCSKSFCQYCTGVEKFSQNNKRQYGSDKIISVESLRFAFPAVESKNSLPVKENPLIGGSAFPCLLYTSPSPRDS